VHGFHFSLCGLKINGYGRHFCSSL
jgi:hypothetical protein